MATAGTNINDSRHAWQGEKFFSSLIAAQLCEAQHF
ncbi:hypothetical protein EPIR_1822 [Erwinia piriflorinigrans CFBP 5888]|uniref:Uncharacterized protein n=1 Tax=Erwinia piriflorinigrans CFBP 5888 TaxID=1161919 RepID=V5Z783_9GAMM|nr:hypothetical protein EPIR_1822 [Erwinia piriflorinigrans CFBP 5888]